MEFRRLPEGAAVFRAPQQNEPEIAERIESSPVDKPTTIPNGFEYPRQFSSTQRWKEMQVPFSDDFVRFEQDSEPQLKIEELAEFLILAKRYALLDGEIAERETEQAKIRPELIRLMEKSDGGRGAGFEDINANVNVSPSFRRRVDKPTQFRQELGVIFSLIGSQRLSGTIDIPEGLRTSDGAQVTSELLMEGFEVMLDHLGISREDQEKILHWENTITVNGDNWKKVAQLIKDGHLSPDTVSATEVWGVKVLARQQPPKSTDLH